MTRVKNPISCVKDNKKYNQNVNEFNDVMKTKKQMVLSFIFVFLRQFSNYVKHLIIFESLTVYM